MASGSDSGPGIEADREERLEHIRTAESLPDLARRLGTESEHEAYFLAKDAWAADGALGRTAERVTDGLPGDRVSIDGTDYYVHGITHADSDAERRFVREHVDRYLDRGAAVYCEQGIRPMYLEDYDDVCEVDDYTWAMQRCAELDIDSHIEPFHTSDLDELVGDVASLAAQFREATFSLIESGRDIYGEDFTQALGDVASDFLSGHEDLATGEDFEAFAKTRHAAADPGALVDLQDYYRRNFLPQPLEREWLRRHDRELEIVTHARNERIADYVVHDADATEVHVLVGAAHQPGVTYYLERYRDGTKRRGQFDYVE